MKVKKITRHDPGSVVKVYDVEVANNHNFYPCAEHNGESIPILTHNSHKLTGAAAEALLVPLEEPSSNTIWILCSTNPEKMLGTITNRCTRMALKPIEPDVIVKRLNQIAENESYDLSSENAQDALKVIADFSNGSLREAISLLEGVLYAVESGADIDTKDVVSTFVQNSEVDLDKAAASLVAAMMNEDIKAAIKFVRKSGNVRGLVNKSRWLLDYIIGKMTKTAKFTPYSGRVFDSLIKNKGIEESLDTALHLQMMLVDAEFKMNSCSIDESVLMQTAIAKYAFSQEDEED